MPIGELFSATVERIAAGGAGVLSFLGKRVFMDLSAPGDRVVGRITEENRGWARAELVELTDPSPLRTEPRCPLYGRCGGCSLQHLSYEAQIREKQAILRDALTRIGKLKLPEPPRTLLSEGVELRRGDGSSPEDIPFFPSPPYDYRYRMQLHWEG
jgi:23S rRNA (uracil1939-C5)-methyltransferase